MTVYMVAPTGRCVFWGTLAREFNKGFFQEVASNLSDENKPLLKFFKDRQEAQEYQIIHTRAGLYELTIPKKAYRGERVVTKLRDATQLDIDFSQVKLESIQNVTVIELPSYKSFTISNPYVTHTEAPEIKANGSIVPFQFKKNKQ